MKHNALTDCIPFVCGVLVLAGVLSMQACDKNIPPAAYLKTIDCQFHVLEKAFNGNEELIDKVLEVGQGPFQLDEYVEVAVAAGKTDIDIIAYGKALNECLPPELRAEAPVESLLASYKSNLVL